MPSNPKLYLANKVYFVTSRTESGLPFVAAEHIKLILEGILARATESYNVTLCHYLWMGNHFHMILVVRDPEALSQFLCYIKTESAHMVNRLLGRRQRTVWVKGGDSPILLTSEATIERIAYLYANPALANLVDSIDNYPMLSSWEMYQREQNVKQCHVITRDRIPALGPNHLSLRHQRGIKDALITGAKNRAYLKISPYAWTDCFAELQGLTRKEINELVISALRNKEAEAKKIRLRPVIGVLALQTQNMDFHHNSKKFSKKMICISTDKELRINFIRWAKELFNKAKLIYIDWKNGNTTLKYPPGLFPPRAPRLANLLLPL